MMSALFLLDTNFFIQSHRDNYPLDVATSFWNKVKMLANSQKLISIDKVKEEIYKKEDEIKKWCVENLPYNFFLDTKTQEIIQQYREVMKWASCLLSSKYTVKAVGEFSEYERADAWLVAVALTEKDNFTIVTYEKSAPQAKNKIKIPDACNQFEVNCIDVIGMFRQIGETF